MLPYLAGGMSARDAAIGGSTSRTTFVGLTSQLFADCRDSSAEAIMRCGQRCGADKRALRPVCALPETNRTTNRIIGQGNETMLYTYGTTLGMKMLLRGEWKRSLPYLVKPVNYWRTAEYRFVVREADFQASDRVLDIGSPKLLSIYLADKIGAQVFSTDIESYFVRDLSLFQEIQSISPEKLRIMIEDGRRLSFDDNSFSKVYSISVVEHIPDDGDTECLKEIGRVLAQGGRCIITVPFSSDSYVENKQSNEFYWARSSVFSGDGKIFYQRHYSEEDLFARLIRPSGLALRKLMYIGEKVLGSSEREVMDYLPRQVLFGVGPFHPLLSKLLLTKPVASWQELKKPLCALLVLEKQ